jgi:hypothetical protein
MTYAVVDTAARRMRYARAGHNPLIHLQARLIADFVSRDMRTKEPCGPASEQNSHESGAKSQEPATFRFVALD